MAPRKGSKAPPGRSRCPAKLRPSVAETASFPNVVSLRRLPQAERCLEDHDSDAPTASWRLLADGFPICTGESSRTRRMSDPGAEQDLERDAPIGGQQVQLLADSLQASPIPWQRCDDQRVTGTKAACQLGPLRLRVVVATPINNDKATVGDPQPCDHLLGGHVADRPSVPDAPRHGARLARTLSVRQSTVWLLEAALAAPSRFQTRRSSFFELLGAPC